MSEKKKGIIKEQNHKLKMFSFLILISLIPLLIAILITSLMSVYMSKNYLEKNQIDENGMIFILFTYLFNEVKILKKKIENLEKNDTALSERIQENTGKISNIQSQRENVSDESRQLAESVFDCSPTDGLSPISEEEAKRVWEEFKKEYNIDEYGTYYVQETQIKEVIPNTYLYCNYYQGRIEGIQATFTRKAYVFICNRNNENLDWVDGYVDIYTGKVIGGRFYGV